MNPRKLREPRGKNKIRRVQIRNNQVGRKLGFVSDQIQVSGFVGKLIRETVRTGQLAAYELTSLSVTTIFRIALSS